MKTPSAALLFWVATSLFLTACDTRTINTLTHSDDPNLRLVGQVIAAKRPVSDIPFEEERETGRSMAAMLLGADPLLRDAEVQHYVNAIGRWVALHSDRPDIPWHFGVINTPDSNAFALPGGYILISTGLLKKLKSEAELACVLGHEIVHVQNRHHLSAFKRGETAEYFKTELSRAAEKSKNKEVAVLAANATKGYLLEGFFERGLDKKQEFDADRQGVVLAARSGYNPYAMAGVLQMLGSANPKDVGMAQWFKTHPTPAERQEQLAEAIGERLEKYASAVENNPRFLQILKRLP